MDLIGFFWGFFFFTISQIELILWLLFKKKTNTVKYFLKYIIN